jgi:DNA-binding SARP family transcriptional activator/pimeloyl-ACP methyl ester carboxylesterase
LAPKERALLAVLVAESNRVVSVERLIDELWGELAPRTARRTLHTYVSHLRRMLPEHLVSEAGGYSLRLGPDESDSSQFERVVAAGRLSLLRGQHQEAARCLGEGLRLWRGEAYGGVKRDGLVGAEAARLDELRLAASEDWLEARLGGGDLDGVVSDIEAMLVKEPLRERLWLLLMRALRDAGRQADALQAYRRARARLVEDLGIEPGPELRSEEQALLQQVPAARHNTSRPTCSYVTNDEGLKIGYWAMGSGARDVVFCAEVFFNLEIIAEHEEIWAFLAPFAESHRLIAVQRRGTGVSDRDDDGLLAHPEACVSDIDAVLQELGSQEASLVGWGHGGQVALAYAALRSGRVTSVAVVNSYGRLRESPDNPCGVPGVVLDQLYEHIAKVWGTFRPLVPIFDPTAASDPDVIARVSRLERLIATPREAAELRRTLDEIDVRALLPLVSCPALVVGLTQSITSTVLAKVLADELPNATFLELPSYFVPAIADAMAVGDAVRAFLDQQ